MKILIVDDNYHVRKMIKNLLGHLAEDIFECNDGDKVIELYSIHKPDWVLMDIKMKNVNGIQATYELKKSFPGAKVIIITNYSSEDFREDAKKAGALEFVNKEDLLTVNAIIRDYQGKD